MIPLTQKKKSRLPKVKISPNNILYDYYPNFDQMTSKKKIAKLEELFSISEADILTALKDRETFATVSQQTEEQDKLYGGQTLCMKNFNFDDIRKLLEEQRQRQGKKGHMSLKDKYDWLPEKDKHKDDK